MLYFFAFLLMHKLNTKEIKHAFTVVKIPMSVPTQNVKDYSHSAESDPGTLQQKDTLYGNNWLLKVINYSQKSSNLDVAVFLDPTPLYISVLFRKDSKIFNRYAQK